ncbi:MULTISPECIES: homoserine kinase [unclassified Pseudoclavibacter]|uniref:homoserine kinase n=1 Tax=unclassified Pseudoclavibacter TaxID=2615177 RepID=UPI0013018854|nr:MULTISPECIES: homoserine kinase [unclassified Pseudoclavibacter]KAB1643747.1 homoserine kinase [Pseudoclavibacter sp. CFCC 14310]KAB1658760.1 homoserine kinase [Pseudoclavibacter sp. CFCC 11306]
MSVRVRVPGTSANLGPGFDSLGIAVDLWNEVEVVPNDSGRFTVDVQGAGAKWLPRDRRNLLVRILLQTTAQLGGSLSGAHLRAVNGVPQSGGLGSSASAVVAGVAAALALHTGGQPDRDEVFRLASACEGHPDNAAPAVYGGATIAYTDAEGLPRCASMTVDESIHAVLLVPDYTTKTSAMRMLQPESVPVADAVFNLSRSALLVHALGEDPSLLFEATEDRLHQPYRAQAMPATDRMITDLRTQGHAAALSGAGPTVLVLATSSAEADAVAAADGLVDSASNDTPVRWKSHRVAIAAEGATVEL